MWAEYQGLVLLILGSMSFLLSSGWLSAMWLSKKFADTNSNVDLKIEKLQSIILSKLEYHERHDDARFSEVSRVSESRFNEVKNDIWDIRIRNAARDKTIKEEKDNVRK